jgi:3-hydroxymyristoyl/3-hydroxydecanoyl-(acyl carrier protein) dehydratase
MVPASHPALLGHFPGNPIVPGALILDRVLRLAAARGLRVTTVQSARFIAPLRPDTPFEVRLSACPGGVDFQVHSGSKRVAHGSLLCRAAATSEST